MSLPPQNHPKVIEQKGWKSVGQRAGLSMIFYFEIDFSLSQPSGPIQSLSSDVLLSSVSLCVALRKTSISVDWRLLAKERIAYIGIHLDIF